MKKKLLSLIMALTFVLLVCSFVVSASSGISVYLDGEKVVFDVEPIVVNGRTMVPMRTIFEKLGATVNWDEITQTCTAYVEDFYEKFTITLPIEHKEIYVDVVNNDGENFHVAIPIDVPAQLYNNRTLVPLRAISEVFGCGVQWDGVTQTVNIFSNDMNITLEENSTTQTMYAPDGRTIEINKSEIEAYKSVGWYVEPVRTMYAPDGRTIVIAQSETEAYKNVGWYESQKDAIASTFPKHNIKILSAYPQMNSVGGAEPEIIWRNDSGKTIKYIFFTALPINAVGDVVSCRITGDTYSRLKSTGPYEPFNVSNFGFSPHFYYDGSAKYVFQSKEGCYVSYDYWAYSDLLGIETLQSGKYYLTENDLNYVFNISNSWDPIWYNNSIKSIQITQIYVEYMDGTTETIKNPPVWSVLFNNAGI